MIIIIIIIIIIIMIMVANAKVHSSTGSMIYRPPHVLVSRVASGRVLGTAGFRVLLCKSKQLVWPVYIKTTCGSLLYEDGGGPIWAVVACALRSGFLCALQFSSIVKQLTRLQLGGDRFMHARGEPRSGIRVQRNRDFSRTDFRSY